MRSLRSAAGIEDLEERIKMGRWTQEAHSP